MEIHRSDGFTSPKANNAGFGLAFAVSQNKVWKSRWAALISDLKVHLMSLLWRQWYIRINIYHKSPIFIREGLKAYDQITKIK